MKPFIQLAVCVAFFSPVASHGFLHAGDVYVCKGFANKFVFNVGSEILAENGRPMDPRHFKGTYADTRPGGDGPVLAEFVVTEKNRAEVFESAAEAHVGSLEKFGRVSYSRVIPPG